MSKSLNRADGVHRRVFLRGVVLLTAGTAAQSCLAADQSSAYVSVRAFGVRGDASDSDKARIQAAIDSVKVGGAHAGKRLLFPGGGIYVCDAIDCAALKDVELIGYGATIRGPSTGRVQSYFNLEGSLGGVVFKGFTFDQMQPTLPPFTEADFPAGYYNCPIYANRECGSVTVDGCRFVNQYTSAIFWRLAGALDVLNSRFDIPASNQTKDGTPAAQKLESISLQTVAAPVRIDNCQFIGAPIANPAIGNCAVFYSGITGQLYIGHSRTEYCGRDNTGAHRLGVFDGYGDAVDVTIENNVSVHCMAQYGRMSATARGRLLGNMVRWSAGCEPAYNGFSVESTVFFGGQKGCQDIEISGNTFDDVGKRHAVVVSLMAYDWGAPLTRIRVADNTIPRAKVAVGLYGPFDDVTIEGTRCADMGILVDVANAPGGVTITSEEGVEADAAYDRLLIRRNVGRDLNRTSTGIQIGLSTSTTARVGRIELEENDLESVGGAGYGIVFHANSAEKTHNRIVARRNRIRGFGHAAYFREGGRYVWQDNDAAGATVAEYLDGRGYLSLERGRTPP